MILVGSSQLRIFYDEKSVVWKAGTSTGTGKMCPIPCDTLSCGSWGILSALCLISEVTTSREPKFCMETWVNMCLHMFTEIISGKIKVFQPLLYVSAYRKKSLTDFVVLGYLFIYIFGFYYCALLDGMLCWFSLIRT